MFSKLKKMGIEIGETLTHAGSAHTNQAKLDLQTGNYANGLKEINSALKHDPHNIELYDLRGQCHTGLGQHQEAAKDYTQAIEFGQKSPNKGHYYQARANSYLQTKDYDNALEDYTQAILLLGEKLELLRLKQETTAAIENEKFQLAQRQTTAEAERQQRAQEQQERARLEQAQRQALEAAREKAAQEAESQRLAAEAAARLEAIVYRCTRIGNWLPDDLAEVFEALSEDYVQEIIGERSPLIIEDEQRISSQVKEIRYEEEAKAVEAARQAEIARLEAVRAAEAAEAARVELENRQWLAPRVFGAEKWKKYFGDVGAEPPLPSNIREVLLAPCPIWPGKRVEETHKLVLIPERVNGVPLTLNHLEGLIQAPREGHPTKYSIYAPNTKKEHGETYYTRSHWILMTRDVIPGSRSKSYPDQTALVARLELGYEVPSVLRAAVCILMEHVETGVRLLSDVVTYTRCLEETKGCWRVLVGGFDSTGLHVIDYFSKHYDYDGLGVSALRMF